jgi:hypothetical protein
VILFNLVTVVTVVIGVLALYLELFALTAGGVLLLVPDAVLADALGRPTGAGDRLAVAWLACSWRPSAARSAPAWKATRRCVRRPTATSPTGAPRGCGTGSGPG